MSYIVNFLALVGFTVEFQNISFDTKSSGSGDILVQENIQVMLLSTAFMYFLLGSVVEYIKIADVLMCIAIAMLGLIKVIAGICKMLLDDESENLGITDVELAHVLIAIRFALLTIFIITLSKWFNRQVLPFTFGIWISNEYLAIRIGLSLAQYKDVIFILSGSFLFIMSLVCYTYYRIDPIDAGYILNEQAINLTSQYIDNVRYAVQLHEFFDSLRQKGAFNIYQSEVLRSLTSRKKRRALLKEEEKLLNRWEPLSFLETLRTPSTLRLLMCSMAIFFKYRVLNQWCLVFKNNLGYHSINCCFLFSTSLVLTIMGFVTFKVFIGRRYCMKFWILTGLIVWELLQTLIHQFYIDNPDKQAFQIIQMSLFVIQGITICVLFYKITFLAILDLSSTYMLRYNTKIAAMLLGVIHGIMYAIQAVAFDIFIENFVNYESFSTYKFYVVKAVEILCTLIAIGSIYAIYRNEKKELIAIKRQYSDLTQKILLANDQNQSESSVSNKTLKTYEFT